MLLCPLFFFDRMIAIISAIAVMIATTTTSKGLVSNILQMVETPISCPSFACSKSDTESQ